MSTIPFTVEYRKKPVVVKAIQWTGDNLEAVQGFVGRMENMDGDVSSIRFLEPRARADGEYNYRLFEDDRAHLWVEANETWLPVVTGEWVIKDPARSTGYFYPCKPDIFTATYEPVTPGGNA